MYGLKDNATDVMRIIDKIDKIGVENVKSELADIGVDKDTVDTIISVLTFKGSNSEVANMLSEYKGRNETFDKGIEELVQVTDYIEKFGVPKDYFKIDLTIARGLDYYTGTVYQTFIKDHPEYGSVCSGGRYDNLAEYYTKKSLPGVGISIGLTRLFHVLSENEFLNRTFENPVEVLVIPFTEDVSVAVETASKLRNSNISTQIYLEDGKFKKKLTYGNKLSIPFCILLGEDEIAENKVSLKNMNEGTQETLDLSAAIDKILAARNNLCSERIVNM